MDADLKETLKFCNTLHSNTLPKQYNNLQKYYFRKNKVVNNTKESVVLKNYTNWG